MSTRGLVLPLLLMIAFGTHAQARLGDTQEQLIARYGIGRNAGQGVLMFNKQNWTITVNLLDGISVGEKYQKQGGPTDDDIAALLSVNAQGHVWQVKPVAHSLVGIFLPTTDPMGKAWERDDGALAYIPGGIACCLTVKSKQLLDIEAGQEVAAKKAKQSSTAGF